MRVTPRKERVVPQPEPTPSAKPVDAPLPSDRDALRGVVAETPASGKKRSIGVVAAVATLGSLLFGYDTGVISGALPYLDMPHAANGLALTPVDEGTITAVLLIGAAVGALVGGRISDRFGRRTSLLWLAILFLVGAVGTAASPALWVMCAFRFVLGAAVGGASAIVPVFLSETAPARIRGTIVAVDQLMIVTGQLLAFSLNAVIDRVAGGPSLTIGADPAGRIPVGAHSYDAVSGLQSSLGGPLDPSAWHAWVNQLVVTGGNGNTWRVMLLLCSVPAIALWVGMRALPESPRWSMANRRYVAAVADLQRIRGPRDGELVDEVADMAAAVDDEHRERKTFGDLWRTPWLRRLFLVGVLLAICNQTTGVNTVMYYAPKVLEYAGLGASAAITAQVANGVMSVLGAAGGLWLVTRFTRRRILITCIALVAGCMFAMATLFGTVIQPAMAAGSRPPGVAAVLVLAVMAFFMLVVQSSNGPVVWTMLGEMFPAAVRGIANGTAVFAMWVVNAIITFTFPTMMSTLGGTVTYLSYGVLNVLVAMALFKVMPETSGVSLEELERRLEQRYRKPGDPA